MVTYVFILLATLAIASALGTIMSKSTVTSALFLVLNMVALAGVYLLLKAQFLAVIQILVYAGAIMVLFLFVIMLLNVEDEKSIFSRITFKYSLGFFLGVVVLAQLLYALGSATGTLPAISDEVTAVGTVEAIGDTLFTVYLFPFEVTAILLTAAVVGALLIAQHKSKSSN
jgi:NADH-quinone oxidoreductase subunit J